MTGIGGECGGRERRLSARVLILGGFGHLGGPIMGVFALLEGDCAISFMYIFPTHSGIGLIFSAKLAQKRQFCARMRTRQHEKSPGTPVLPIKTPCFGHFFGFHSYPSYILAGRGYKNGLASWL
jgi:hypothetical protein